MLPTFLGIGAQRAASSWLFHCLDEHPEVFVPKEKELRFFDRKYQLGRQWYERQFEGAMGRLAVGEISPDYLHDAPMERVAEMLPDVRLFVVLREPVRRAVSAYRLLRHRYPNMSFVEACQTSDPPTRFSFYYEPLMRVLRYFPREHLKIFLYDDILADPCRMLGELFDYLGVAADFRPPSLNRTYNRVGHPLLEKVLKTSLGRRLASGIQRTPVFDLIRGRHTLSPVANRLSDEEEKFCLRLKEQFREDILRTQELIGRDLSAWL